MAKLVHRIIRYLALFETRIMQVELVYQHFYSSYLPSIPQCFELVIANMRKPVPLYNFLCGPP